VSDAGSSHIYTLNPDVPAAAVSSFALPNTVSDAGEEPCGLAITDSGIVYYASFSSGFTGTWAIHKLDTSTGTVTDYQTLQDGALSEDAFTRMFLTTDNARVFGNMAGLVFSIDTATDTFSFNPTLQFGSDYELTLSSNQTWMSAAEFLMDTNLNPESYVVYVDRNVWNQSAVYGEKVSPDGNLLFSPLLNAIDVIDGRLGTLRARIALPFMLSANYDALVDDGRDNVLIAITGQTGDGIAVIDLTSLPEGVASLAATTQRSDLLRMAQWTANSTFGKPRSTNLIKRGTPPKLIRPQHNSVSPALSFGPEQRGPDSLKLL
jgi:streptogramin lyase